MGKDYCMNGKDNGVDTMFINVGHSFLFYLSMCVFVEMSHTYVTRLARVGMCNEQLCDI